MLPKIAFYFDVTVDELLCVDKVKVEEAICEYQRQSKICCQNGENQKNLEIWEKAYSEFPNDCRVIEGLMHAINRDAVYPCPKAEAERIIALGEELLQRSTDTRQRENAVQCLCYTYDNIDKEKALYYFHFLLLKLGYSNKTTNPNASPSKRMFGLFSCGRDDRSRTCLNLLPNRKSLVK